jgi:hypothetical protein
MDAIATALLRRKGRLYLPSPASTRPADAEPWVRVVETDLADRGWLLAASARSRLAGLERHVRTQWADWLLAAADQSVGAHRVHTPLFRSFPRTPANPDALFVERLLAHWFQDSDVRCILCGEEGTVRPVDPCGHLVCQRCFDPSDYTACPICGRRAAGSGVIQVEATRPAGTPLRLTVVTLGEDLTADASEARDELVARPGAHSERDRDDLRALIDATSPVDLTWLPEVVPSRETSALVGAWALQHVVLPRDVETVVAQVASRWMTATDVARTLWAYSGGDPGLVLPTAERPGPDETWRPPNEPVARVPRPRVRALPRQLRRAALAHLQSLGAAVAAEDMSRHPTVWKRLAERVHPFEWIPRFPESAVAFAAVRSTRVAMDSPLGQAIVGAVGRYEGLLTIVSHSDGRISVRSRSFASVVEVSLSDGDIDGALSILRTRPGELWRRVDHLARAAGDDPALQRAVADAAAAAASQVAPGVLAGAAAELRGREATVPAAEQIEVATRVEASEVAAGPTGRLRWLRRGERGERSQTATQRTQSSRPPRPAAPPPPGTPRRVFFPRGNVARSWTEPERRGPLPLALVAELRATVDRELARRASLLAKFDIALIDAALIDVPAPTRTRAASAQLAGWTRGTRLAMPDHDVLRLFLHWVELPTTRVDLDLSCAFFRDDWSHAGHCDYTSLRFNKDAALHSGDLTSAPAPFGATEFLDLTIDALVDARVRYAIPVVFSYNDVPFELLPEAFAGFSLPTARDAQFDPGRVVQRFDLRGDTRMLVPFIIDVTTRDLLWVDIHVTSRGYGHRAGRHSSNLGRLGADLWEHFMARSRPTMLDVAVWHALARANEVFVVDLGTRGATRISTDREAAAVATAIREAAIVTPVSALPEITGRAVLAMLQDADAAGSALGSDCAAGSVVAAAIGRAEEPWQTIRPDELLAGLTVVR